MTKEDQKLSATSNPSPSAPPEYGTFQGVVNYPPPRQPEPAIGFPQPIPPPGASDPQGFYPPGYQTVPDYAVAEGTPVRERRLPCCGMGFGWCLFTIGFFLGTIPWYVGLLILMCGRSVDYREKPGLIACTVAAIVTTIVIIIGATEGTHRR